MRIAVPDAQPLGVELFAGCGGLSTGFMDAGLAVAAGFEAERRAVRAYGYNHGYRGGVGLLSDVTKLDPEGVKAALGGRRVDFVLGGPPCQPFSNVGKRMGLLDPRAECVWSFARLAIGLEPTVVLMENVPAILDHDVVPRLTSMFRAAGYSVGHVVLDAASFGVPQWRERLFLLAMRDVNHVSFPQPTHGHVSMPLFGVADAPFATVSRAIGDLPDGADYGECSIHNHEPPAHSPEMVATFVGLRPGDRDPASKHVRLRPDAPSVTLRAGSGTFMPLRPVHPRYDRVLTVRESARLHGYSDDFVWPDDVPRLHQYRQVGNSVPPAMGRALAQAVAARLGWPTAADALAGDPRAREPAVTMTDEERRALRLRRNRIGALA